MSEIDDKNNQGIPHCSLSEFLSEVHPQSQRIVDEFWVDTHSGSYARNRPAIFLHCDSDNCKDKGFLAYRCAEIRPSTLENIVVSTYLYRCSNCRERIKVFSLIKMAESAVGQAEHCMKIGELPAFGPPIPSRLISIVGADRDLFLKGRRCETQGLGIASFAYDSVS